MDEGLGSTDEDGGELEVGAEEEADSVDAEAETAIGLHEPMAMRSHAVDDLAVLITPVVVSYWQMLVLIKMKPSPMSSLDSYRHMSSAAKSVLFRGMLP